jgi:DNA-binding transcriptional MerR regulator
MNSSYRIGEFAKLAGVTVRALHHYDRIGLLKPQRGNSGFRLYRPEDLERLEQIAALKFLGIPLQEIKLLLKHGPLSLVDSLHMQREALAEKRRLIDRAVVAIEAAEKVIQSGQTTDVSILRKIIEVIDMQPQENFMRKYYTDQAWLDKERIVHETPLEVRQKHINRNLLFRHRFHEIVSLLGQIVRPKERLRPRSQRLRKKSRAIRCRPCLACLIESPPSRLRRHLSILLWPSWFGFAALRSVG